MKKQHTTYAPEYEQHPILTDEANQLGCDERILKRAHDIMEDYCSKHPKALFVRLDIRAPENTEVTDEKFTKLLNHLAKSMKRQNLDPAYLWKKERHTSKNDHMHCLFLLNGHNTKSMYKLTLKANELWNKANGLDKNHKGLIHDCTRDKYNNPQSNGIMLNRNDPSFSDKFDESFCWTSYLAKTSQSDINGRRSFGSSKLSTGREVSNDNAS